MRKWLCIICGLIYDEAQGWPSDGIAPGTAWEDVPDDWLCPDCLVGKADFEMIEITDDVPLEEVAVVSSVSVEASVQPNTAQPLPSEVTQPVFSNDPIVIIGSGHSGYQLAAALRAQSETVAITVFTADDGALYSKPALSNALVMNKDGDALQSESALKWESRLNIRVYPHTRVEQIDRANSTLHTSIGKYAYSRLVLATGASPIEIPIEGDRSWVMSVNDLVDYRRFRSELQDKKRIAILGDGLIGCEFANDLIESGYEVTVIGLGQWPMERLIPQQLGESLQSALAERGVQWALQDSIARIEPRSESSAVLHLNSGKQIEADLVLSAVGLKPNVSLAERAGLEVGRGIKVNQFGQTSDESIYSLGDCVETEQGWQPYIAPINQMIPSVAKSLLGDVAPISLTPTPVIVKTPILPLTIFPVAAEEQGQWYIENQADELTAAFYSPEGAMLGFALLGRKVQSLRGPWLDQLSLKLSAA
ncbi:FAD-dependent oxidoreductase [Vibrio alginolyticus]|jgi:rubredoxin-NAD+ reductase|uniref:FAD-dependent oxidoreductase n=1 Tax=Vibrio alginolyticus TaxID=663 RepID=UPI001DE6DEC3|nr:rubredoxin-NAD(+) reductase [Vibrio alginolyticus]EGR0720374.1 rubredoxin-NAD(+) reductase [Vibrio alginolyticus]EHC9869288.1 FAD-dependent oxidoreductase [Vibrio alginolyticus]EIO9262832.1 FAD-dependent oxidoreductase [Vibrio alginolyticus]EJE3288802.1 FAD-dependent oxidoreductase [Vibrio alginolyticus]